MGRVDGKVAIVTGAGSGLGEAMARLLAREGARVLVTDINREAGERVAAGIVGQGGEALFQPLDVTDEAAWRACGERALQAWGKLNVLVNNAGISAACVIEEASLEEWRRVLAINLDSVFLGSQLAVRLMRQSGEPGSIINISSIEAMIGHPMIASYNASKGGVRALTKSTALYCAQQRLPIRVNSVHPGGISTPLVEEAFTQMPPEAREAFVAAHPIGHLGEPDDVAYAVLYLASDESRFVLGAELVVDGGYLAQ